MINHQFIGSFPIQTSISIEGFSHISPDVATVFVFPVGIPRGDRDCDSGGPGSESSRAAWLRRDPFVIRVTNWWFMWGIPWGIPPK